MSVETDLVAAQQALQAGQFKRAHKIAKGMVRAVPKSPVPPNVAGIALSGMGKTQDAIVQFKKALQIAPDFHDARRNMAQTLLTMGRAETALSMLQRLSETVPDDPDTLYLLAQATAQAGSGVQAIEIASQMVAAAPKDVRAWKLRAQLRLARGMEMDSIADLEHALTLNPNDAVALTEISLPLARQLRTQEARQAAERAVAAAPDYFPARMRLATSYVEEGRNDLAEAQLQAVLSRDANHAFALEQLSAIAGPDALEALQRPTEKALAAARKRTEDRASLEFALARIAEAAGNRKAAAASRQAANATMAAVRPYDAAADTALTDRLLARFAEALVPAGDPQGDPRPIYVVGLPRSGTTLTEAILGAHDKVLPLGERGTPGALLQDIINRDLPYDAAAIAAFRSEDLRQLPGAVQGMAAYVDKMPENYRLIGFLMAAYPDARVVSVRRDPRDIALSMWRAHFSGSALSYSYDLKAMAHHFNQYARMMAHWRSVFPERILDLDYEDLVTEVDATGQRLAAFCGLDWQPAMARPDLAVGQVLTVSATQIRQPVHSRSVGAWQKEADLLRPFMAALDRDLWPQAQTD